MALEFLDRDSSWMDFNDRILHLANDPTVPLLERVNFLSITSSNLDEFFQVRIAGLLEEINADENSTLEQRNILVNSLIEKTKHFNQKQDQTFVQLLRELQNHNISIENVDDLESQEVLWLSEYFEEHVYPVLTPLAVDPAHPFPWISSLSVNLAFILREPKTEVARFARVKIPTNLQRFIRIGGSNRFIPLEKVIQHFWERLFPGYDIESHFLFRITRSSQYQLEDNPNLLDAMTSMIRRSKKFGRAVRLEIEKGIDSSWTELLQNEITLDSSRIIEVENFIDFTGLAQLTEIDVPELKYPKWHPRTPNRINRFKETKPDLFSIIRERDLLIHRPYESYEDTVLELIKQAAKDDDVLAIKQTIYRAADVNSKTVQALCSAAESGKQVVALVELKARFDEQLNIKRAKKLEQSGVHVVYGKVGLKTHAKLLHIVREEGKGLRYYSHISTGNYNSNTATIYEDFDLFTADERIGRDVGDVFNDLTGYSTFKNYRELIVAPISMRTQLLELIEEQSNEFGSISIKCNNLVDKEILQALYRAGEKGAQVRLAVRTSCGFTHEHITNNKNLKVRSIVGRFLEHSRLYKFGNSEDAKLFIGSADLMSRNLDNRVEVLVPIYAVNTRTYLNDTLNEMFSSDIEHWSLTTNGWQHNARSTKVHSIFMDMADLRSRPVRLSDTQRNMPENLMNEDDQV